MTDSNDQKNFKEIIEVYRYLLPRPDFLIFLDKKGNNFLHILLKNKKFVNLQNQSDNLIIDFLELY